MGSVEKTIRHLDVLVVGGGPVGKLISGELPPSLIYTNYPWQA
jgi:hypothetical protein